MGEPEFRRIEHEQLRRVVGESVESQKPRIVSLGGGTISQPENLALLRETGAVLIWLQCPIEELLLRCATSPTGRFFATKPASGCCISSGCRRMNRRIIASTAAASRHEWWNRFSRWEFFRGWSREAARKQVFNCGCYGGCDHCGSCRDCRELQRCLQRIARKDCFPGRALLR